jgi:predicted aspartyl protease
MPHFTLQLSPKGPLLTVVVRVSDERYRALVANNHPIPAPVTIRALIDTGASITCIDPSVLRSLSLSPTGSATVNTPSTGNTPVSADQYDVSITIHGSTNSQIPLVFNTIPVIQAELLLVQGFHALIGRDILEHCFFSYNGSAGFFTLAY